MLSRPPAPSMTKCRLLAQALIHFDAYYYPIPPLYCTSDQIFINWNLFGVCFHSGLTNYLLLQYCLLIINRKQAILHRQGYNVLFLQLVNDIFCQIVGHSYILDAISSTKSSIMDIDIFLVSLHSTKSVEVGHSSTSPLDKLYLVLQYIRINRTVSNY